MTELYGAGLARVVELLQVEAPELLTVLVDDELLGSLFVVHDLHPRGPGHPGGGRAGLGAALPAAATAATSSCSSSTRPSGAVHLRLLGSCDGCPSSAVTLRTEVERAIAEAAPEIVTIDVEEPNAPDAPGVTTAVELGRKPEVAVR